MFAIQGITIRHRLEKMFMALNVAKAVVYVIQDRTVMNVLLVILCMRMNVSVVV